MQVSYVKDSINALFKQKELNRISLRTDISEEQKRSLIEKLSKIDDLKDYYQKHINYYQEKFDNAPNDIERARIKKYINGFERLFKEYHLIRASNEYEYLIKKAA